MQLPSAACCLFLALQKMGDLPDWAKQQYLISTETDEELDEEDEEDDQFKQREKILETDLLKNPRTLYWPVPLLRDLVPIMEERERKLEEEE